MQDEVNEFDDLIWGVTGIAAEIKRTERQTYHLIQIGAIPTKKVGAIHTARKSKLRARLLGEDASDRGGAVMGTAVAGADLATLAADINENHELAVMYVGQGFDHAVKADLLLIEAKAQVQHGKWLSWLKANVKVSARQAQNYMKIASAPERKRNGLADLSIRKAIHELALRKAIPAPSITYGSEAWKAQHDEPESDPSGLVDLYHPCGAPTKCCKLDVDVVVGRNEPTKDMDDALGELKGFRVRLCIDGEKDLQILGCGWRIITCQFRDKTVLLHHNGNAATMKRKTFREFLASGCCGS